MVLRWIKEILGLEHNLNGRWYIYELRNPLTGRIFYEGKGKGDRSAEHEQEARRFLDHPMRLKHKHKVIIEIWDAGLQVEREVIFRTDNECEAYQVEAARILEIGLERLTNEQYGWTREKLEEHRACPICGSCISKVVSKCPRCKVEIGAVDKPKPKRKRRAA